jgi:hypothetical protein
VQRKGCVACGVQPASNTLVNDATTANGRGGWRARGGACDSTRAVCVPISRCEVLLRGARSALARHGDMTAGVAVTLGGAWTQSGPQS